MKKQEIGFAPTRQWTRWNPTSVQYMMNRH